MEFEELLSQVGSEPLFDTGFLLAGAAGAEGVRRQLCRWVRAGRVIQLRRGLYALAEPFRKVTPHPFLVSNRLFRGSYVSLEAALASYGLIPEAVPVVTAVGGGRPERLTTPLGAFEHRHVRPPLVRGGQLQEVAPGQKAFVASPEKALLDVVYLNEGADAPDFLRGLRLQHMERLDADALTEAEALFGTPKMARAARNIRALAGEQKEEYREL